jgi:hypothetical protein
MAKAQKQKTVKAKASPSAVANLDLDPNAWPKFEKLIKNAAKMGRKPHATKKPSSKKL